MAQSLSRVFVHLVFSTKNRQSLIDDSIESNLFGYMAGICRELESPAHQIGGMTDHVHVFLTISRKISISEVTSKIKSGSSAWIKKQRPQYRDFSWQNGFGAFSIGRSGFDVAMNYIANQKEHHKTVSFQDEFRKLLKKYDIEFDEKYVWD